MGSPFVGPHVSSSSVLIYSLWSPEGSSSGLQLRMRTLPNALILIGLAEAAHAAMAPHDRANQVVSSAQLTIARVWLLAAIRV